MVQGASKGMLAQAHVLVDVEGPDDALTLEPLLAMAHGRPVLSSRERFATLLETSPLPLRFAPGDGRQLADRMKSLAAAWSDELDGAGQTLRDAVRQEHSVAHWAEAVASIVGFVRTQHRSAGAPIAPEPSAEVVRVTANSSSARPRPRRRPSSPSSGRRRTQPRMRPAPKQRATTRQRTHPKVRPAPNNERQLSGRRHRRRVVGGDGHDARGRTGSATSTSSITPSITP